MVIPSHRVFAYLDGMEMVATVDVRKEDMTPAWPASLSEATMLAAAGCVEGRGSATRLRFLRLLCSPETAQKMSIERAESLAGASASRADEKLMALDALQRMVSARKFTFKEAIGPHRVICHKTPVVGFMGLRWAR